MRKVRSILWRQDWRQNSRTARATLRKPPRSKELLRQNGSVFSNFWSIKERGHCSVSLSVNYGVPQGEIWRVLPRNIHWWPKQREQDYHQSQRREHSAIAGKQWKCWWLQPQVQALGEDQGVPAHHWFCSRPLQCFVFTSQDESES